MNLAVAPKCVLWGRVLRFLAARTPVCRKYNLVARSIPTCALSLVSDVSPRSLHSPKVLLQKLFLTAPQSIAETVGDRQLRGKLRSVLKVVHAIAAVQYVIG